MVVLLRLTHMKRLFDPSFPFEPQRSPVFYGWIIAAGSVLGALCSIPGQTMGFTVFTEILMAELSLTRVELSGAYFAGTVASGLALPFAGRLYDHWGARRMIVFSSCLTGLVLLFLSATADISRLFRQWLPEGWPVAIAVIGVGFFLIRFSAQGVLTITSRNVVGKWFDLRRGLVISLSGIFISFGFSFAPKGLDYMIGLFDYDGTWRLLALLTLLVMAPLGWLIYRDNPEECGLTMDGPGVKKPLRENLDMKISREYTRGEAVRTFSFHAFNLSFAFFALYSTAFTFNIESIGIEFGFEKSRIINLFVPMAVVSVATSLIFGWVNSRTRLKFLLFVMNLALVFGAWGLFRLDAPWGVPAFVLGNGIGGGIFANAIGLVWPRFYGRRWIGSISGLAMSSIVIASGMGPWIFALSEAWTGSYSWILVASITVPAALCIASLFADNPQRRL